MFSVRGLLFRTGTKVTSAFKRIVLLLWRNDVASLFCASWAAAVLWLGVLVLLIGYVFAVVEDQGQPSYVLAGQPVALDFGFDGNRIHSSGAAVLSASWGLIRALAGLGVAVLLPATQVVRWLSVHAWRHAALVAHVCAPYIQHAWNEFAAQESASIVLELSCVLGMASAWAIHRLAKRYSVVERVRRRTRQLWQEQVSRVRRANRWIQSRSQLLGVLMPHAVFCATVLSWYVYATDAFVSAAHSTVLLFGLSFLWPLYCSIQTLLLESYSETPSRQSPEPTNPSTPAQAEFLGSPASLRRWLCYWIPLAALQCCQAVPWSETLAVLVPYRAELWLAIVLWLVNPITDGGSIAAPLAGKLLGSMLPFGKVHQSSGWLERSIALLRAVGLASERQSQLIHDLSGSMAGIGLLFLFTPSFITVYGILLVNAVIPIFSSLRAISYRPDPMRMHSWLVFWCARALLYLAFSFASLFLHWMPLWTHLELVLCIWLLVGGAPRLFELFVTSAHPKIQSALTSIASSSSVTAYFHTPSTDAIRRLFRRHAAVDAPHLDNTSPTVFRAQPPAPHGIDASTPSSADGGVQIHGGSTGVASGSEIGLKFTKKTI